MIGEIFESIIDEDKLTRDPERSLQESSSKILREIPSRAVTFEPSFMYSTGKISNYDAVFASNGFVARQEPRDAQLVFVDNFENIRTKEKTSHTLHLIKNNLKPFLKSDSENPANTVPDKVYSLLDKNNRYGFHIDFIPGDNTYYKEDGDVLEIMYMGLVGLHNFLSFCEQNNVSDVINVYGKTNVRMANVAARLGFTVIEDRLVNMHRATEGDPFCYVISTVGDLKNALNEPSLSRLYERAIQAR